MNPVAAVSLLAELLRQAMSISQLIQTAHAEGRDLTKAELDAVAQRDDAARQALVDAISKAPS